VIASASPVDNVYEYSTHDVVTVGLNVARCVDVSNSFTITSPPAGEPRIRTFNL
jgi:hypothetical protein